MSATYTHAHERDQRHAVVSVRRLDATDLLMASATVVGLLIIVLTYGGVGRRAMAAGAPPPIDLRAVANVRQLETALADLSTHPADRRLAAVELFRFLTARASAGERLANVAAILAIEVPAATIDSTPGLAVYADRLRLARESAQRSGRPALDKLRLFTAADLAAIKPAFVVRTRGEFGRDVLLWGAACLFGFHAVALLWRARAVRGDRLLLAAAHLLTALGFAALLSRADPLRDTLLFVRYTAAVLLGLGLMGVLSLVDFRRTAFVRLSYVPLLAALTLSMLLILFGHGPGRSGAKVNLGPVQPIEAIRLLLAMFLAGYFARRWELLRQTPRAGYVLPVVAGVGAALAFFILQKDLGPALFLTCVFLVLHALATRRLSIALAGFALLAVGFYAGYRLNISDTLSARVAMWQSPWDNAVRGGDQIAQSLWALATGGFFGAGPGLGSTRYLPAGHTDLVLAAVGEELGLAGLALVAAAYAALAWRGLRIALAASTDYGFFLATAIVLFLVVPVLVMSAGILGVIPLTGVVTPFLSYGGSAMTANFAALGILTSIDANRGAWDAAAPFRVPVKYLRSTLTAAGAALAVVLATVQLVKADDYASRPHVGVQADGVRRQQHNPRILDVIRDLPRGTIYDRTGLPLATGAARLERRARDEYTRLGAVPNPTCAVPSERCYPLGGLGFHFLGDAVTRLNWSATNSSYLERDAQNRLRGFDEHRELLPVLRHRYDPDHADVRAVVDRNRDLRLALDGRFQVQVAGILARYAQRSSKTGRAAAVVLDPETGGVLALASYPWPVLKRASNADVVNEDDALLDRARYGLYPPGSTFKLVTAAAALRRDAALSRTRFMCHHLPSGRVGVQMPAGGVIRDDVLDTRPHGSIEMRDGIVHSCNAYFAQLAVHLGAQALVDTAMTLGMSVAPSNALQRVRSTLPQAGYGQGDIVVTPVRMARMAAALAGDGTLRDARLAPSPAPGEMFLPPDAARLLARYMREAVLSGTARSLRDHPWRIAGKTGTAEVAGAASHSWFVGFAPYGKATKRVAFAVLIENAGYGSLAAAPVAGEIVTAAASLGVVR